MPLPLLRQALVRSVRRAPQLPLPRRFQSTHPPPPDKKTFRGQLYDSTVRRVQAERATQEQRMATGQATAARPERVSSATLGGVFAATSIAIFFYYLGSFSSPAPSTASTAPLAATLPPKHDISKGNLEASWSEFVNAIGADNVKSSEDEISRHSSSPWSSYHHNVPSPPFLILYPATTEEVSAIAKICHRRNIPITPFSGGTSLEGHFAPTRGGVVIDFSHMNKILSIRPDDLDVTVQPAVGWEDLNEHVASRNLFFPPDPGPGAMIGGMVGTGCSGTNAARYGTMREWVLSLTVVLADGTVIRTRRRPRKSSAGYDLTRLFIGSEGTLGLVTEATLKLAVKPPHTAVAVAAFPDIARAAQTVAAATASGLPLAAIELLDDVQMHCINEAGTTSRTWAEQPTLFLKFAGTPAAVKESVSAFKALAGSHGASSFTPARSPQEAAELWSARKEALWSVMALRRRETDKVWTTDVAVPLSRLPDIIGLTKQDISDSGLLGAIVGHVGDGNFHAILMFGEEDTAKAEALVGHMVRRAIDMDGTVTGEHGVGLVKRAYLESELGRDAVDAMRRIKLALDPRCLLNCDKVVRVEEGR